MDKIEFKSLIESILTDTDGLSSFKQEAEGLVQEVSAHDKVLADKFVTLFVAMDDIIKYVNQRAGDSREPTNGRAE